MSKPFIGTTVRTLIIRGNYRKEKRMSILDSKELLRSLHLIKDRAVEKHTKNNLDILINQIYDFDLDH